MTDTVPTAEVKNLFVKLRHIRELKWYFGFITDETMRSCVYITFILYLSIFKGVSDIQ